MWGILRRAIVPLIVLAIGVAALVYGVEKHTAHVFEEQEIEITLAPPPLPPPELMGPPPGMGGFPDLDGPPGMDGMSPFGGGPGPMSPFGAPPPELQKVKQTIFVGKDEPEPAIVLDTTIGGLVLLESGELRRTYSGQPPSLCPT